MAQGSPASDSIEAPSPSPPTTYWRLPAEHPNGQFSLVRSVLHALGAALLIFGLFEGIEWSLELQMEQIHMLHRMREFVAAVVAAVVAGYSMLKQSPSLLATPLSVEHWSYELSPSADEQHVTYAQWFILMRWIAIVTAALLVYISVQVVDLLPQGVWFPLLGTIVGLVVLNLFYTALVQWGIWTSHLLSFQAYADLAILTILLHYSGGIENPLALLMIFHVIIAGIVLTRRQCFAIAATAIFLFAALAWAELTGVVDHYTLQVFPHVEEHGEVAHAAHASLFVGSYVGLHGAILLLTAVFVTSLAERLRQDEQQLETMAEHALTQRQMLEQALETTGTGLCVRDQHLNPMLTNGRWDRWTEQRQNDEILRQTILDTETLAQRTLADGEMRVTEVTGQQDEEHSDTTGRLVSEAPPRTFQVTTAPLHDKGGQVTYVVQFVRDITEQKAAQARMMRAGQLAAVGELAGQVAHEVNNPIGIISAKARLLLADHRDSMSEKTAQELIKIIKLSDRVAGIAGGLLSYCRPSTAQRTRLSLCSPIRSALSMVEQRAKKSGIQIEDQLPERLPMIKANPDEMEQVFLNLFLNALDAMLDGGRLIVTARMEEGQDRTTGPGKLAVVVEDTGSGIPADIQSRIFEPFYTTKPEGEGTGLGLSICQGLVKSHGGYIDVQSTPGEGTRITVSLPITHPETESKYG